MITKISYIKRFGSFADFEWDRTVKDHGNAVCFNKLNIIYGRNYSGKTTLSRVLRSYKKREIHSDYRGASFKICDSEFGEYCESELESFRGDIRVYNADFVDDNLKLLRDKHGKILPFAVVGARNVEVEDQIAAINTEIGDENSGLMREYIELNSEYKSKKKKYDALVKAVDDKLTEKARSIKTDAVKYNSPTYTITKIKQDIETVATGEFLLSPEALSEKEKIILDDIKPSIEPFFKNIPNNATLFNKAEVALAKVVKPSESILDLLSDPRLQSWVRDGIIQHRGKRTTCAFCSNDLPPDLWTRLDAHFSKESEKLRSDIQALIADFAAELGNFCEIREIPATSFYAELRDQYCGQLEFANKLFEGYRKDLALVKDALVKRESDIFNEIYFKLPEIDADGLLHAQDLINNTIAQNNLLADTAESTKATARKEVRLHAIADFLQTINYFDELKDIATLGEEVKRLKYINDEQLQEIQTKRQQAQVLRLELSDERKGAEEVNQYLRHYFGHNSLELATERDSDGSKFVLMRGAEKATNLSEGECSLVAFCYFMAKLKDLGASAQDTVIWIDDPISSLDSNHVFFVFSLIETVLAHPVNFRQLFISTHNVEFLKYLKRITPPYKNECGKRIALVSHFLLENDGRCSRLVPMPKYLKNYSTEFNYLFNSIYRCAQESMPTDDFDYYYSFGNNLRKFLEAYLFYRYPNNEDLKTKMKKFFGEDKISNVLTQRVDNELSHLEQIFDRSLAPVEIPEMQSIAKYILSKMEEFDKDQYAALVASLS